MGKYWKRCIYFCCIACGESLIGMASLLEFFVLYIPLKGNSCGFMRRMLKKHSPVAKIRILYKIWHANGFIKPKQCVQYKEGDVKADVFNISFKTTVPCHLWWHRVELYSITAWACKIVSVEKKLKQALWVPKRETFSRQLSSLDLLTTSPI